MQFIIIFLIGISGGMLGALFGVGGGIIMVPALLKFTDLTMKEAVATSLTIIIITSAFATANNASARLIDWRLVAIAGVGAALAAYFGSAVMRQMNNETLTRMFAIFMLCMGTKMLWDSYHKPIASSTSHAASTEVSVKDS
jgi:uncharacterized membrane protein YfcA